MTFAELKQQTDAPSKSECLTALPPSKWGCYSSPRIQIILTALIFISCPGLFNALSDLLGDGHINKEAANNANTAFNITFAVFSILGGCIFNLNGSQLTLFAGCITYTLYNGSFLLYNKNPLFIIINNAVLGIGAGLLWAAQAAAVV